MSTSNLMIVKLQTLCEHNINFVISYLIENHNILEILCYISRE